MKTYNNEELLSIAKNVSVMLQNLTSVEGVVSLINNESKTSYSREEITAYYILQAAEESVEQYGGELNSEELEKHAEFIAESGAVFDHDKTINLAIKINEAVTSIES